MVPYSSFFYIFLIYIKNDKYFTHMLSYLLNWIQAIFSLKFFIFYCRFRVISSEPTMRIFNRIFHGISQVAQRLRIRLPMQGTGLQALVWEDPTRRGATKPVCHNYWSPRAQSPRSTTREATTMKRPRTATKSSPRPPQPEKARAQQPRPNAAKNKQTNFKNIPIIYWDYFYRDSKHYTLK